MGELLKFRLKSRQFVLVVLLLFELRRHLVLLVVFLRTARRSGPNLVRLPTERLVRLVGVLVLIGDNFTNGVVVALRL